MLSPIEADLILVGLNVSQSVTSPEDHQKTENDYPSSEKMSLYLREACTSLNASEEGGYQDRIECVMSEAAELGSRAISLN